MERMNVLEKILEEIEEATYQEDAPIYLGDMEVDGYVRESKVKEIIRSHMDEVESGDWILCSERLPEVPEGIEDDYCPEFNVTIKGADKATTLKCAPDGTWFDDSGEVYNVIAWKPLPTPYRAADDSKPDWKENMLNTFLAGH